MAIEQRESVLSLDRSGLYSEVVVATLPGCTGRADAIARIRLEREVPSHWVVDVARLTEPLAKGWWPAVIDWRDDGPSELWFANIRPPVDLAADALRRVLDDARSRVLRGAP